MPPFPHRAVTALCLFLLAAGWLPATLQTMILACLARLLAQLEHLVLLFQSGQLPTPAIRPTHPRPAPAPRRAPLRSCQPARVAGPAPALKISTASSGSPLRPESM